MDNINIAATTGRVPERYGHREMAKVRCHHNSLFEKNIPELLVEIMQMRVEPYASERYSGKGMLVPFE